MTTSECTHTNAEWLSGTPGVVVTLNGDTAARCLDCGATATIDTNAEWLSGTPGVVVTLNGDTAARCLDCGATATIDTDDEPAAPLAHQWQSGRFTGTTTCQACGLLPLDQDDIDTECPGG